MTKSNNYDACMAIMVRISVEDLAHLRQAFLKEELGLSQSQFVQVMLTHLPWTDDSVVSLVEDLIELFAQIDVNGDGTMEWQEFTNFLVEAGMDAITKRVKWKAIQYEVSSRYSDSCLRQIRAIKYLPELGRLLVLDKDRPIVRIYDPASLFSEFSYVTPDLKLCQDFHPHCNVDGYRRNHPNGSSSTPVQAIEYLSSLEMVAVSAGDLKLSLWNFTSIVTMDQPPIVAEVPTPRPQRLLAWSDTTNLLFSADISMSIRAWSVTQNKKKKCRIRLQFLMTQHTDLIQDLIILNDSTIASGGMDNRILLWDTRTGECKSSRIGHKRGIQCLERCSDILFISSGFELDIIGWDASGISSSAVFRLRGHSYPVIQMRIIPEAQQAISLDTEGNFRWWDIQQAVPVEDAERCLQTFRFGTSEYCWKPITFAVMNNGEQIIAGKNKLKLLERVRLKSTALSSCAVLYNSVSFTILTATDKHIQIWDASTAKLLREYLNISSAEITQVVLDDRQRKFIIGNQTGEILVCDYLNGALIKAFTPHQSEVTSLIYCTEDKLAITASWDRSLRVYDKNNEGRLLRCVNHAHNADITKMAFSHALSLVATASIDGVLRVWDYVYFSLEGECNPLQETPITAITFFDPYAVLISGHEDGSLCFWSVRPWKPKDAHQLLHCVTEQVPVPLTHVLSFFDPTGGEELADGVTSGRHLLITADEQGFMTIRNISKALTAMGMTAMSEKQMASFSASYNPRRSIYRDGTKPNDTNVSTLPSTRHVNDSDIQLVETWRAHAAAIRSIDLVEDGPYLLTTSMDKSVVIWSLQGEKIGVLCSKNTENLFWQLKVDKQQVEEQSQREAAQVYQQVVQEKYMRAAALQTKKLKDQKRHGMSLLSLLSKPQESETDSEKTRIFAQLKGKETWKKSAFELAAQDALDKTRVKYQERLQSIMGDARTEEDEEELDFPKNQMGELPFEHQDNWKVNSQNRQAQLYTNLYGEFRRSKRSKKPMKEIDIRPSAFLLSKLGPEKPLRQSRSMPVLPKKTKPIPKKKKAAALKEEPQAVVERRVSVVNSKSRETIERLLQEPELRVSRSTSVLPTNPVMTTIELDPISKGKKPQVTATKSIRTDARLIKQTHFGQYSRDEVVEVYKLFARIDKDGSKSIELEEFMKEALQLNSLWLKEHLVGMFASVDRDESGEIDLGELFEALFPAASTQTLQEMIAFAELLDQASKAEKKAPRILTPRSLRDIKDIFRLYDKDNSGGVDVEELLVGLNENKKFYGADDSGALTLDDVKQVLSEFDTDQNMTLDLDEFIELFRDAF